MQTESQRRNTFGKSGANNDCNSPNKGGNCEEEALRKISELAVTLHDRYLAKCRHAQIYRDLSDEEQKLLRSLEKTSLLHSILAGMLAIDSCCKAIEKEEERVLKNCMKGLTVFLGHYKRLEDELAGKIQGNELYLKLQDSLKYFSYQLYILPTVARLFPDDITKQKQMLSNSKVDAAMQAYPLKLQTELLSEYHEESQDLKRLIKERQNQIINLERKLLLNERNGSSFRQSGLRLPLTVEQSRSQVSQIITSQTYSEIEQLRGEVQDKNEVIVRINKEFTGELDKYKALFKRLEQENGILKKYMDVDTAYLLQELEREIDVLREQKRRDQFVIQDIQRKIGGMSSGGPASNSRLRILGDPNYIDTLPYNDYGQVVQGYSNLPKSPRSKQYQRQSQVYQKHKPTYGQRANLAEFVQSSRRSKNINLRSRQQLQDYNLKSKRSIHDLLRSSSQQTYGRKMRDQLHDAEYLMSPRGASRRQ